MWFTYNVASSVQISYVLPYGTVDTLSLMGFINVVSGGPFSTAYTQISSGRFVTYLTSTASRIGAADVVITGIYLAT